jgi:phage terminase small subunit
MTARIPVEVHAIHGTKGTKMGTKLPEQIKQRIPFAEWAQNPSAFNAAKFVEETAEYLYQVYGIGSAQDRHTLIMLADQLQIYVNARQEMLTGELVVYTNGGKTAAPNPHIAIANNAVIHAIKLMNELGLTPKSRLATNKTEDKKINDFLSGPKFGT